jgi:hypothetical protein
LSLPRKKIKDNTRVLLWCETKEIQIFSFASFASIRQVPTVLASPGWRVANAFGGFAISTTHWATPEFLSSLYSLSKSTYFYIGPPLIIPILPCRVAWPDDDRDEHFVDIDIGFETVGLLTQGIDHIERQTCQSLCSHRCPPSSSGSLPFLSTTIYRKLSKLFVSMLLRQLTFPSWCTL